MIQYILRGLDNPLRQRILALMYSHREALNFTEVARRLGVADDSSVSFHLNRLTGPGLVSNFLQRTPGGIRSIYTITPDGIEWMKKLGLAKRSVLAALLQPSEAVQ